MVRKLDRLSTHLSTMLTKPWLATEEGQEPPEAGYRRWIEDNGYSNLVYGEPSQREIDEGIRYSIPSPRFLACVAVIFIVFLSFVLWQAGCLYTVLHSLGLKSLEFSYVAAVLLPFAADYGRRMEKKYGEFGVAVMLRGEIRREIRDMTAIMQLTAETIPAAIRTEMKEMPQHIQHATKDAFSSLSASFTNFESQLDKKFEGVHEKMHSAMNSLPEPLKKELSDMRGRMDLLPGQMTHEAELAWTKSLGEIASMKAHLTASEAKMKMQLEALPAEVSRQVKVQFTRLTDSMSGLTHSIQGEFSLVKSHVSAVREHLSLQQVKADAQSFCGATTREPAQPI